MRKKEVGHKYASIDIGSEKIKLVIAVMCENRTLLIENYAYVESRGINRGEITNIDEFSTVLNNLIKPYKRSLGSIMVNISSLTIKSFDTSGSLGISSKITKNNITAAITASSDYISSPKNTIKFDYPFNFKLNYNDKTKQPIKQKAKHLKVYYHLITIDKQVIDNIVTSITNKNELHIEATILSSIALSAFNLTDEQKRYGVCLLDIGAQTCDIIVIKDYAIKLTATIGFGGDDIDTNISHHYDCEMSEAKKLKENYGFINLDNSRKEELIGFIQLDEQKFLSNYQLAEVIQQSLTEFLIQVKSTLENKNIKAIKSGFVLTGRSSKINGIANLAIKILNNRASIYNTSEESLKNNKKIIFKEYPQDIECYNLALALVEYIEDTAYLQEVESLTNTNKALPGKITKGLKNLLGLGKNREK